MASDWDSEKLDAEGLLRWLSAERLEEDAQQRGLLKRWPEAPLDEDAVSSSNSKRFIPELFLRDNDEDSFRLLQTYVRRIVEKLWPSDEGDHLTYDGQCEGVEALGKLSDQGVVEAIPDLLQNLERRALLSIYTIITGKANNVRNRAYLVGRAKKFFNGVLPGQPLTKPMQDVVTILRHPDSYKKMESRQIELAASSPVEAAHSALLQVDQIPLRDMHVMLGTLINRRPRKIGLLHSGGNKDRITTQIRKIGYALLASEDGDELPEPLRKALIVMSLSARYTFGSDGKLINFLGPVSVEKQSLHSSILSALSDISNVKNENLLLLYKDLVPHSDVSSNTNSATIRNNIRAIFLDCLLNSEIRPVPEYIMRAVEKLNGMMRQQSAENAKSKRLSEKNVRRSTLLELEAVLRVSSHLQQIIHDLSEYSEESFPSAHESNFGVLTCSKRTRNSLSTLTARQCRQGSAECAFLPVQDAFVAPSRLQDEVATLDYASDGDTGAAINKQIQIWSFNQTLDSLNEESDEKKSESQENCQHDAISPTETKWLRDVTQIGDETAEVGYTLIGCALEEMSRLRKERLETPVKSYLRSGVKRMFDETEKEVEQDLREQDQVSFILSLAQKDARISSRTMDRVKRRLLRCTCRLNYGYVRKTMCSLLGVEFFSQDCQEDSAENAAGKEVDNKGTTDVLQGKKLEKTPSSILIA